MKILITAGPTREPIDAVRFIGNRSSGTLGHSLCTTAIAAGHQVTAVVGPIHLAFPSGVHRIDVETTGQMQSAVLSEFPKHDLLIMAAAVADFRPMHVSQGKLTRTGKLTIECEATQDILSAVSKIKRPDQRVIGFSLEARGNVARSREKLVRKNLDLIVYNPLDTMSSSSIEAVLLWPDGREESLSQRPKADFAKVLIDRGYELWARTP